MSLFQKSVENKYLSELDSVLIDQKYKQFQDYFGNPEIQENIRNSKEEQFQEGFLRELFVKIFGYTLNPQPNFNLTTELKNISNSRKADGAILRNGNALAVIELKGTDTADLDTIETQAFGYKNHHPKCVYVITSNFEKLRFYIQNAVEHLDFDLFNLSREQFSLIWLCLASENLLNDLPLKIKESSVVKEEGITKELYTDYSTFRKALYTNLVQNNPDKDKLLLFKKTQKLLDRFLFIFFAEDRLLLPPNSISEIVKQWKTLKEELDEYIPLYDRYKKYFGYLNTGFKGKKYDIYAYNGGLFAPDEILDTISIDDDILHEHTLKLSSYDFETDVDVNILGHIFEHSLVEIENVQAEIKGETVDNQATKRKKDGIFYTPKYITKYIVENTIGKLCEEKRAELNIIDEEYAKGRRNRKKDTIKTLDDKLTEYRNWLLSLSILDPACGSGAFLNQALDFLITEHQKIDNLKAQLFGAGLIFSDITTDILEKNIYGVDINEESVEIAKLSLWLRTAQKGRKLNKLNNNIKCGNSLIDDFELAGEKAFNWQDEFPEIFAKGGFDVVIGNPPYVNIYNMNQDHRLYFESSPKFKSTHLKYDLYVLFFDKGLEILKESGLLSYIIPSVILSIPYGKLLREQIVNEFSLERIVDFSGFKVFSDAMVESCILGIRKIKYNGLKDIVIQKPKRIIYDFSENSSFINQSIFKDTEGNQFRIELDQLSLKVIEKIKKDSVNLESIYYVSKGIVAFSKVDNRKKEDFVFTDKLHENYYPYLEGRDVERYLIKFDNKFLAYDEEIMSRPTFPELHQQPKILVRAISGGLNATFDNNGYFIDQKLIICSNRNDIEKFINPAKRPKTKMLKNASSIDYYSTLGILNSKLSSFYYAKMLKGGVSVLPEDIRQFPMNFSESDIRPFIKQEVENILKLRRELEILASSFAVLLSSKYSISKLSLKLQSWYQLELSAFLNELEKTYKKAKTENDFECNKLSLSEKAEWMQYFNEQKQKATKLEQQIQQSNKQIDQMVYELYGLNEEEIEIVEESV